MANKSLYVYDKGCLVRDLDEFQINWYKACGVKIKTVHLSIAHINHDVNDNSDINLIAECQRCHLKRDRVKHSISRLAKMAKRDE